MAVTILPAAERHLQQICDNQIKVSSNIKDDSKIMPVPDTNPIIENTPQYTDDPRARNDLMTSSSPISGKPGCALVVALVFYMIPVH